MNRKQTFDSLPQLAMPPEMERREIKAQLIRIGIRPIDPLDSLDPEVDIQATLVQEYQYR